MDGETLRIVTSRDLHARAERQLPLAAPRKGSRSPFLAGSLCEDYLELIHSSGLHS